MVLGEEPDAELALALGELARLDMKPVWPFLLHLYGDHAGKRLSKHDLLTLTRLVTAYVMRRAVCGDRPAAPPPVFATASRSVDPERHVESVRAYFLCLPDGSAFPSDEAFRAELVSRNMYRFRHCEALLERLENDGRKEPVPLSSFTVDHIMPQGERLPDAWKAELGPDWAQTWQSLRHTLGNLTLTAFNTEMGNRPFRDKRDAEKGWTRRADGIALALPHAPDHILLGPERAPRRQRAVAGRHQMAVLAQPHDLGPQIDMRVPPGLAAQSRRQQVGFAEHRMAGTGARGPVRFEDTVGDDRTLPDPDRLVSETRAAGADGIAVPALRLPQFGVQPQWAVAVSARCAFACCSACKPDADRRDRGVDRLRFRGVKPRRRPTPMAERKCQPRSNSDHAFTHGPL